MSVSITQVPKNLKPVFQASANACRENASKPINVFALAVVVESPINYEKDDTADRMVNIPSRTSLDGRLTMRGAEQVLKRELESIYPFAT